MKRLVMFLAAVLCASVAFAGPGHYEIRQRKIEKVVTVDEPYEVQIAQSHWEKCSLGHQHLVDDPPRIEMRNRQRLVLRTEWESYQVWVEDQPLILCQPQPQYVYPLYVQPWYEIYPRW